MRWKWGGGSMRKLSELYQIILDKFHDLDPCGICGRINELAYKHIISIEERKMLSTHFQKGKHKFPYCKRIGYWFSSVESRIEYLKYLIKLCKEQDI